MKFFPHNLIYSNLYFLELENYHIRRYIGVVIRSWRQSQRIPRQVLHWTTKMKFVTALSLFLQFLIASVFAWLVFTLIFSSIFVFVIAWVGFVYVLIYAHFLLLALAVVMVMPLDYVLKRRIVQSARKKIQERDDLIIIGIAGSYGKTTTKEVIATILQEKFQVLKTPESINTPVGIARLINERLMPETQVCIIEMGAYQRGDIQVLTRLLPPNIGILTGINESHLERFGTIEETVKAKFEIANGTVHGGVVLFNANDPRVVVNYKEHIGMRTPVFYSATGAFPAKYHVVDQQFFEDGSGIEFKFVELINGHTEECYSFKIPLLGAYSIGTVMAAVLVAEKLGMTKDEITRGAVMLRPTVHRLQPVRTPDDILVIDDSYNGNPNGVREAIVVLNRFRSRRKIFVTPGLVEMGSKTEDVHREIAAQLMDVADLVLLIRNSATVIIGDELIRRGYPEAQIKWFESAVAAHTALPDMLHPKDVVLFQNDWPDNYH